MQKNNYYERTYYTIKEAFGDYTVQSGIDESEVNSVYDANQVENDIKQVVEGIYENKKINISTDEMIARLDIRINEILKQKNRMPDSEEKEAIKIFEKNLSETYADSIMLSEKYITQVVSTFAKLQKAFGIAFTSIAIVTFILLTLLLIINKERKERLQTIGTALIASGMLGIMIKLFAGNRTHSILIFSKEFSETAISLIDSILHLFLVVGIVLLLTGIALVVIVNKGMKEKKTSKHGK